MLNLGEDKVYLSLPEEFNRAWGLTETAILDAGMFIDNKDRTKGLYYVTYNGAAEEPKKKGMLSKLKFWGHKDEPKAYQISLTGVGDKTAAKLLVDFGSLEGVYEHLAEVRPDRLREKLAAGREDVMLWRELVTIDRSVPIELDLGHARLGDYDRAEVLRLFREYEFRTLVERLPQVQGEEARAPGDLLREADRALEARPRDNGVRAYVLMARGRLEGELGHAQESQRLLDQALQLDPTLAEAHLNLAMAYPDLGRERDACTEFARRRHVRVARQGRQMHLEISEIPFPVWSRIAQTRHSSTEICLVNVTTLRTSRPKLLCALK